MSKIFPIDNYYPTNAECNNIDYDELPKYYYYIAGRQQACVLKYQNEFRVMVKNYSNDDLFPGIIPRGDKFYCVYSSHILSDSIHIFRKLVNEMLGLDYISPSIISLERISQYLNDYIALSKKLNY